MDFFSFCLCEYVFISFLKYIFTGYRFPGWQVLFVFPCSTLKTTFHCLWPLLLWWKVNYHSCHCSSMSMINLTEIFYLYPFPAIWLRFQLRFSKLLRPLVAWFFFFSISLGKCLVPISSNIFFCRLLSHLLFLGFQLQVCSMFRCYPLDRKCSVSFFYSFRFSLDDFYWHVFTDSFLCCIQSPKFTNRIFMPDILFFISSISI